MNRIILIGNGFDLAHGLKTSYADFIDWYWKEWGVRLLHSLNYVEEDGLCVFKRDGAQSWSSVVSNCKAAGLLPALKPFDGRILVDYIKNRPDLCSFSYKSRFFDELCKQLEERKWVDIENVFYKHLSNGHESPESINNELAFVRSKLIDYLTKIQDEAQEELTREDLRKKMFASFRKRDFAIGAKGVWLEMIQQRVAYRKEQWQALIYSYFQGDNYYYTSSDVENYLSDNQEMLKSGKEKLASLDDNILPQGFLLPDNILLLNFNYTNTANSYLPQKECFGINHIHGELNKPESVIFGYGDEIDENYKKISNKNDNEYLKNIKSIKYLESPNYRSLLDFIESDAYQIFIFGHSCGNSDRTLLNTLFEHKNCVSIKPFYHQRSDGTDNYMELVKNISRNFTDMKLMRDRVVNKTYCEMM